MRALVSESTRIDRAIADGTLLAAPTLIAAEVANALVGYVRAGRMNTREARSRLRDLLELPIELVPIEEVAEGALRLALARNLSVYDAYYVDLAHTRRAVLLTADRALAAAYERSELVA